MASSVFDTRPVHSLGNPSTARNVFAISTNRDGFVPAPLPLPRTDTVFANPVFPPPDFAIPVGPVDEENDARDSPKGDQPPRPPGGSPEGASSSASDETANRKTASDSTAHRSDRTGDATSTRRRGRSPTAAQTSAAAAPSTSTSTSDSKPAIEQATFDLLVAGFFANPELRRPETDRQFPRQRLGGSPSKGETESGSGWRFEHPLRTHCRRSVGAGAGLEQTGTLRRIQPLGLQTPSLRLREVYLFVRYGCGGTGRSDGPLFLIPTRRLVVLSPLQNAGGCVLRSRGVEAEVGPGVRREYRGELRRREPVQVLQGRRSDPARPNRRAGGCCKPRSFPSIKDGSRSEGSDRVFERREKPVRDRPLRRRRSRPVDRFFFGRGSRPNRDRWTTTVRAAFYPQIVDPPSKDTARATDATAARRGRCRSSVRDGRVRLFGDEIPDDKINRTPEPRPKRPPDRRRIFDTKGRVTYRRQLPPTRA